MQLPGPCKHRQLCHFLTDLMYAYMNTAPEYEATVDILPKMLAVFSWTAVSSRHLDDTTQAERDLKINIVHKRQLSFSYSLSLFIKQSFFFFLTELYKVSSF